MKKHKSGSATASLTSVCLGAVAGGMPSSSSRPSGSSSRPGFGDRALGYAGRAQDAMFVVNTGRQLYQTGRELGQSWKKHTGLSGRETVDAVLDAWGPRR